jgi:hypothetical protein
MIGRMAWFKAAWIDPFFSALDTIAPNRDRRTDGTIGDLAHSTGTSGHNPDDTAGVKAERTDADTRPEVRAADAGIVLRTAITMQQVVDAILAYPPDRNRLIYIIFDGYVYSAGSGWARRKYTGADPHRTHVHLSGHPDADNDGRPWQSILSLTKEDDMSEWTFVQQSDADQWKLSQGTAGYAGQARDTALAFTWKAADTANAKLDALTAMVAAQTTIIQTLADAVNNAGGSVDTAAILEAMDAKLAQVMREQRDAVADLGEGGAAKVRADTTPDGA